jgi:TetR/AcrR family transcriptional repressor of nem operon
MSQKKQEIIQIASDLLQKGGVNGFSFRDLAEAVGVKSSSVHYHFANKNDLFLAIIINFRNDFSEQLQDLESQSDSVYETISKLIDVFESQLVQENFCLCGMLAADQKHLDQKVIDELNNTFDTLHAWLSQVIKKDSPTTIPAEALAKLIISSLEGSLLIDRVSKETKSFDALRLSLKSLLQA